MDTCLVPDRLCALAAPAIGLTLALGIIGSPRAEERKPDTSQRAYDLRVGCAGIAAAAVARSDMMASKSEKERADARTALIETRDEALQAGDRVGLTGAQVSEEIGRRRDGILKRFVEVADKPEALEKEKADLGRVVIECALVEAIEPREAEKNSATDGRRP